MKLFDRFITGVGTAIAALALTVMPAEAVVGGTEDTTNQFSNVALTYVDGSPWCTGTLYRNPSDPTSRRYSM
jgi:hypothetical protein